jgi:tetrahydromethanopterin S-methyltransferase subunit A
MHNLGFDLRNLERYDEAEQLDRETMLDCIDDDALRKRQETVVKQEQLDTSPVVVCLPQFSKASHAAEGDLEVKSSLVMIEVKELLSSSEMVTTTDVVTTQDGTPKLEVVREFNPSACLPREAHTQTAISSRFAARSC